MASKFVRQYITKHFSIEEKESYLEYINGNKESTDWIEKGLHQREPLINLQLTCSTCQGYVNIKENGYCTCSNGHKCYNVVIPEIEKIIKE
jgi:hypothetical protein